jgi:hypothetical protein
MAGRVPSSAHCWSNKGFAASIPSTRTFVEFFDISFRIGVRERITSGCRTDNASLQADGETEDASSKPLYDYPL